MSFSIGLNIGIVLSIGAAILKSGKSIFTKANAMSINPYTTSFAYRAISALLFIILLFIFQNNTIKNFQLFAIASITNSIILASTTLLTTKALEVSDISIITPLMALLPITVTIPAWIFLDEKISIIALFGILLVCFGAYILELNSKNKNWLTPFFKLTNDKGAQYVGLFLVIASVIPTIDKIGLSSSTPILWVTATHTGMSVLLLSIASIKTSNISTDIQTNVKPLFVLGLFNTLLWIAQIFAYQEMQVAYVQAIKRGSIFLSILAGYLFFNETRLKARMTGAVIILFGISLIIFESAGVL